MPINQISTPEPHYIPGYAGYCPQYAYRFGDTFGNLTHKLLVDPNIRKGENLILSNRVHDDFHMPHARPVFDEVDLVKAHEEEGDPVYKHPMIPGYAGFLPFLSDKIGKRFSVAATEGIADYEKHLQKMRLAQKRLKRRTAIQEGTNKTRSLGDRQIQTNDYQLPLEAVRPECEGNLTSIGERSLPGPPPIPSYSKHTPPHFLNDGDPEKYIIAGYSGHVPFAKEMFGKSNKTLTNKSLREFSATYKKRKSLEWAPITNRGVSTEKSNLAAYDIYPKNEGLIPNYTGHVPGLRFTFGKTFSRATVDARANNN